MGKQNALLMFLSAIAPVLLAAPFAFAVLVLDFSGIAPILLISAVCLAGLACLVGAKWPILRRGEMGSLGPRQLSDSRRALYWSGYLVLGFGGLLALAAICLR